MNNFGGTIRFSGTIFWGGLNLLEDAEMQQLTNQKSLAKVKKLKKIILFFGAAPPFFCQKAPKKALFCCQYVFLRVVQARLGVDGE
jgi:hypothetical protein